MTPQEEALDVMKRLRIVLATSKVDGIRVLEPISMAIEALQKWIAKPPSRISEEFPNLGEGYWCDECGALFPYWDNERQRTNYCGNCGQRLLEEKE